MYNREERKTDQGLGEQQASSGGRETIIGSQEPQSLGAVGQGKEDAHGRGGTQQVRQQRRHGVVLGTRLDWTGRGLVGG